MSSAGTLCVAFATPLPLGDAGVLCTVQLGTQKSQFFVTDFLWGHIISFRYIKPCKVTPAYEGGLGVCTQRAQGKRRGII